MKIVIIAKSGDLSGVLKARNIFQDLGVEIFVQCPDEMKRELLDNFDKDHIWLEPISKGTSIAIGVASVYAERLFKDEIFVYIFANQYVTYKERLLSTLRAAEDIFLQLGKTTFIGVTITSVTDDYGYFEIGKVLKEIGGVIAFEMKSFERNPNKENLKKYSESWNYLWDTGYLLGKPKNILKEYKLLQPELYEGLMAIKASLGTKFEKEVISTIFDKFETISFAKSISEKINPNNVVVVPVDVGKLNYFDEGELDK